MKIIRLRKGGEKIACFKNKIVTYGKAPSGKYRIELNLSAGLFTNDSTRLYSGIAKPRFKNICIIAILFAPIVPFYIIGAFMVAYLYFYFEGCINFFRNGVDITNVRHFNWANIAIMVLLT